MRCFHGVVEICVFEDDEGTFSAEFERHSFQVGLGRICCHDLTHFRTTSKSHFVNQGMLSKENSGGKELVRVKGSKN